jgi:ABC-type proline/glycine betaine transport system permease subunit
MNPIGSAMHKIIELGLGFIAFVSSFIGVICLCCIPIDLFQMRHKSKKNESRKTIWIHIVVALVSGFIVYGISKTFGYWGLTDESQFLSWIKYAFILLLSIPAVALLSVIIPFTVAGTFIEASQTHDWHIYFKGFLGVILELLIFGILYWILSFLGFSLVDFVKNLTI